MRSYTQVYINLKPTVFCNQNTGEYWFFTLRNRVNYLRREFYGLLFWCLWWLTSFHLGEDKELIWFKWKNGNHFSERNSSSDRKCAFLFAKNCTSLFAEICTSLFAVFSTFLFAKKCTLLFTVYMAAISSEPVIECSKGQIMFLAKYLLGFATFLPLFDQG